MKKDLIIYGIIFLATLVLAFFKWHEPWVPYFCGIAHTICLFSTIGKWIAYEQDRGFTKWLRESTDSAAADIASVGK